MSDNHDASIAIQKQAALAASIAKINSLHEECCGADEGIKRALLFKINKGRECGLELIACSKTQRGNFKASFPKKAGQSGLPFPFSYTTAKIYMRFARAHPDPITDIKDGISCLKDALIASGALSAPTGHGVQALHTYDFIGSLTKRMFEFKAVWGNHLKREELTPDQRDVALDVLAWPAKKFLELGGKVENLK